MKTIRQVANELGVSKDKVKYRVGKLPDFLLVKKNGVIYITNTGIAQIRADLDQVNYPVNSPVYPGNLPTDSPPLPTQNDDVVEVLKQELEIKNKQIEALTVLLSDTTEALKLAQQTAATAQALHAGTMQQNLIEKPRPWYLRIFGDS